MQTTVRVPLTVEKRADIGDKLASLVERIKGVKAEAKGKAFAYRAEIEGLQEEQEQLAAEMILGLEDRPQMSLTFAESEAAKALHDVAAAACTCDEGPEAEVKNPTCPIHGVDAQPAKVSAACDGDHAAPQCADPECWLIVGPDDEAEAPPDDEAAEAKGIFEVPEEHALPEPSNVVDMADARSLRDAEVEVGTVEEPAAARAQRRRR